MVFYREIFKKRIFKTDAEIIIFYNQIVIIYFPGLYLCLTKNNHRI